MTLLGSLAPTQAAEAPRGFRDPYEGRKKVLVVGDLRTGNQIAHDGVSHAMAVIEQLGRESGAYVAFLRTDTDLVTKGEVWGKGEYAKGGPRQARGRNLDYFDAVVFYTNGETEMTPQQKADLLSFVHDDGKGFIAIHTGNIPYPSWQAYADMIGANWENHPWNVTEARVRVERPEFPVMAGLPAQFTLRDEFYQYRAPYTRDKVDVLLSIDPTSVDLFNKGVKRGDADFPLVWAKAYGKGRVLSSALGHPDAAWDDPLVRRIHLQGIQWALGLTEGTPQPHAQPRNPADLPLGRGPHKAVMLQEPSLPTHTVYRPARLEALGTAKLPVVAWGNGACVNMGNRFRYFLTEIASQGYLVLATGPEGPPEAEAGVQMPRTAGGAPRNPATDPPATQARQLNDAIDWALRENRRRGSPYYGRIDTRKIAVMGQSCGGAQAIVAGADPRVTTTVVWNSGTFATGPMAATGLPGAPATKASLKKLHGSVAYFSGDESDIAHPNAKDDFARIDHVPVIWAWPQGVGHSGTYREAMGGEFSDVAVAWLDWKLKGSLEAARWFSGPDCRLCQDSRWTVQRKGAGF